MGKRPRAHNVSTAQDVRDAAACANQYLALVRCPGGRLNVHGYICPHCGMDTSDGDCGGTSNFTKESRP